MRTLRQPSLPLIAFALLFKFVTIAKAQFVVNAPSTDWVAVPYRASAVLDVVADQASGTGETDIIGNSTQPSFFTKFVPGSTTTDGTLYFRVRVGADQGSAGFSNGVMIGMDGNLDGQMDLFVGVKSTPRIWKSTGTQCISPATTSLKTSSPVKKYTATTSNYNWSTVNAASATAGVTLDPAANTAAKQDLNSSGGTDYFVSFSLPFADVVAAFASKGITFNSSKLVTYVLGTGGTAKTYDQDLNGVTGGLSSATTWASLGALSQPLYVNGTAFNTAPVNTVPGSRTANGSIALSGVSVADAEGNLASVQLTGTNGTLSVSLAGGASILSGANNSATFTLGGTLAQINAALATLGYTPTAGYTGSATVSLLSKDSSDATASSTIAITVINTANNAPVAANDSATTHAGKAVTVYVIGNDVDADGNVLTITTATLTSGQGTVSYANGNVTYTPPTTFSGTATISYAISDGRGGTSSAVLTVTVTANGTPAAVNDTGTANLNSVVSFDVLANDSDPDGDALTITNASRTSGLGSVAIVNNELEFSSPGSFGTTVISYTISDGYGGTATAQLTIVSGTNTAPVARNDSATANSGVTAQIDALANDTDADGDALTITDVVLTSGQGVVSAVNGLVQFTPATSFAGTATITYTIDDNRGGTATATITVTVTDATAPTISGSFAPLSLTTGAGGTVALPSYVSQAVTSDNVAVTSITQSPAAGSARSVGKTTVTLTASDAAGNTASTSFDVTVTDGTAPTITGTFAPLNLTTGAGGTVALPSYPSQAVTSDNVAVTSVTQSPGAGSPRSVGKTTVTLTASDAAGNTASTNFDVTVTDGTAPTITGTFAPLDLTTGAAGTVALPSYLSQAITSDNVAVTSVTQSPAPGSARSVGKTTVTLTASDAAGNTASASFDVNVTDGTAPTITGTFAPLNLTTGAGGTVALPNYLSQAVTSDNVAVTSVTQSPAAGSARSAGKTIVTLIASDAAGNAASTSFEVTVADGTAPTITGTFAPLNLTSGAGGTAALPNYVSQAVTGDNVGVTSVTQSPAPGSARSVGTTTVTLTASDAAGNTASASFDVAVADGTDPTISGTFAPLNLTTGASGTAALPSYVSQATSSDNVAVTSVVQSPAAGTALGTGKTTVTLTASDAAGNTASASFDVTVTDGTDPTITGTFAPMTLTTGADGTAALPSYISQSTASDNVAVTSVTQSPVAGSALNAGKTTVTLTASDAAGNTASTSFEVTVIDGTDPSIAGTFAPLHVSTGAGGTAMLPSYVSQAATSDNVGITSVVQSPAAGTALTVGETTVTLTASDAAGNTASTSFTVTVTDGTDPAISGTFSPLSLTTGAGGMATIPNYLSQAVTSDNVAVANVTQSPIPGATRNAGTTTVTLIAFDAAGNTASTSFDVTIIDGTAPTISGSFTPLNLTTGAGGTAALPSYLSQAAASDNVAVTSVTQSPTAGTALPAGETTVTVTASDAEGNVGSSSFIVTIHDGTDPTISGTFSPLSLSTGTGGTVALPSYTSQAVTSDEVGVAGVTQSPEAGSSLSVGTTTVTVTAADAAGNTASKNFTVTVTDGTAPTISGTFFPRRLITGTNGTVALPDYAPQAEALDNVGVTSIVQSPVAGSARSVGTTTVTLTASDAAGNTASTSFDVVISDSSTVNPLPITLPAAGITPGSAIVYGSVIPRGVETQLSFEYSRNASLAGATTSASISAGSGSEEVTRSIPITDLDPNTRYYYRAVSTSSSGTFYGAIESFLTPMIVWGSLGAPAVEGQLDITRIVSSPASTTYSNVSSRGYDIEVATSALGGHGYTSVTGQSAWWLEGSAPTSATPATVRVRFYEAGTKNPYGVMGIRFQLDDAEQTETLLAFSYFTETGGRVSVPWNSPIFTYSHTPSFGAAYATVENGAPNEGMAQSGKWVEINLSNRFVSGFEFQLKRRSSGAGSVIMSALSSERSPISMTGNFTPTSIDTDATGFATIPDYRGLAVVTGATTGVTVTQSPVVGTAVAVGRVNVNLLAENAAGDKARTGFELRIRDKTPPVVSKSPSWTPPVLISPEPMPDFTPFITTVDNVAVTRLQQSPSPGTISSEGICPVTITAMDAAGNVGTFTFAVTVDSASIEGQPHYSSLAAKGSPVPGSGTVGIPAGAVFRAFGQPSINDSRASAFVSTWTKGTQSGKTLFAGNPLQPVTGITQPAAGISGATFSSFKDPVLNNAGTSDSVAFLADVLGGGVTSLNNTGLWTNLGGQLQLIARESAPAAGTTAIFKGFTAINLFADEILFTATLAGPGITTANDTGLWSWSADGGMKLILREGQRVLDGKTLTAIQILTSISGSPGHGRHHLAKGFHAARIGCADGTKAAVFIDCSGMTPVVEAIATSGKPIVPGINTATVGTPSGNASGTAAFTASLSTGPALIFNRERADGSNFNSIVARRGGAIVPGLNWSSFRDPVLNVEGAAAWLGKIASVPLTDNDLLAFSPNGEAPVIVAREGAGAPGTDSVFHAFTSVALPDGAAGPVFSAVLRAGTGNVTTASDTGLWAVASTGQVVLLFREGDIFGTRAIRKIQALDYVLGSPGQARSFNSTGSVIVLLTFTDGSQSLVRSDIP